MEKIQNKIPRNESKEQVFSRICEVIEKGEVSISESILYKLEEGAAWEFEGTDDSYKVTLKWSEDGSERAIEIRNTKDPEKFQVTSIMIEDEWKYSPKYPTIEFFFEIDS